MYTREDKISSNISELSNYIEEFDVFNSKFLYEISKPGVSKVSYKITVYEERPDLIAKDFYGSDTYLGIVLIQGGTDLSNYAKGNSISLIPKEKINSILNILI